MEFASRGEGAHPTSKGPSMPATEASMADGGMGSGCGAEPPRRFETCSTMSAHPQEVNRALFRPPRTAFTPPRRRAAPSRPRGSWANRRAATAGARGLFDVTPDDGGRMFQEQGARREKIPPCGAPADAACATWPELLDQANELGIENMLGIPELGRRSCTSRRPPRLC